MPMLKKFQRRPKSAMSRLGANLVPSSTTPPQALSGAATSTSTASPCRDEPSQPSSSTSWFRKSLIGRTPSLPSSLGKRKESFFKKLQSRKISAPSFASSLRPHRSAGHPQDIPLQAQVPQPHATGPNGYNGGPPPHPSRLFSQSCSSTPIRKRGLRIDVHCGREEDFLDPSDSSPPIFFYPTSATSEGPHTSSSSLVNTPIVHLNNMEEAVGFIEDLRERFRIQGQQVIAYRRKLRQQRVEISALRSTNREQLEEISSHLLLFESNLRAKEKHLIDTLNTKDQVILKQQKVIKKLLRKCYGSEFCLPSPAKTNQPSGANNQDALPSGTLRNTIADLDAQNDSDSAIMMEDNVTEVSLLVPTISFSKNESVSDASAASSDVKVFRSISDVVKVKQQQQLQQSPSTSAEVSKPNLPGRKTKEERRISNRQKLLTIAKRHSGFLKRPEILETVYSVEEDGEQQQQQHQKDQKQDQEEEKGEEILEQKERKKFGSLDKVLDRQVSVTDSSPSTSRRGSSCILTGFRYRFDSDSADPADYSTEDDDSTRLFYSETDNSNSLCGSRRSSYGGGPFSLPCSRRSSAGILNLISSGEQSDEAKVQSTFNRVMMANNLKSVVKPKDVKFKRINKSKSRSLEELRGKLKWQVGPSMEIDIDDKSVESERTDDKIAESLQNQKNLVPVNTS